MQLGIKLNKGYAGREGMRTPVKNRRIHVVYYGAGVVGKTTNLFYIHDQLPDTDKSDIMIQYIEKKFPHLLID